MFLTKLIHEQKNVEKSAKTKKSKNSPSTFFGRIFFLKSVSTHKIMRFLIPTLFSDFFYHNSNFSDFWMQMSKKIHFQNFLQKAKPYFFASIYPSPFDSH